MPPRARRRPRTRLGFYAQVAGVAAACGGLAVPLGARAHASPPLVTAPSNTPAEIGRPRPALEVDSLDGNLINDARLSGRRLVVVFFATWCQPCHRALADLMAARAAAPAVVVDLLLIDFAESDAVVRKWAVTAKLPPDVTVAVDPTSAAARRWGARRLPTTFIIDSAGVVRHINRGWGLGYRDRVSRWLRALPSVESSPSAVTSPP